MSVIMAGVKSLIIILAATPSLGRVVTEKQVFGGIGMGRGALGVLDVKNELQGRVESAPSTSSSSSSSIPGDNAVPLQLPDLPNLPSFDDPAKELNDAKPLPTGLKDFDLSEASTELGSLAGGANEGDAAKSSKVAEHIKMGLFNAPISPSLAASPASSSSSSSSSATTSSSADKFHFREIGGMDAAQGSANGGGKDSMISGVAQSQSHQKSGDGRQADLATPEQYDEPKMKKIALASKAKELIDQYSLKLTDATAALRRLSDVVSREVLTSKTIRDILSNYRFKYIELLKDIRTKTSRIKELKGLIGQLYKNRLHEASLMAHSAEVAASHVGIPGISNVKKDNKDGSNGGGVRGELTRA
eukprot:jgi/Bigna1/134834/aug1.27_g9542